MGIALILLALQDADRLRLVAADTLRDIKEPAGFWTDARARAAAELISALNDVRLIEDDALRPRFDALIRAIGAGCPYRPVPEKSEISRLWNDAVFELWLARIKGPLSLAKSKLNPSSEAREQARALARAVNRALEPAREMLEREEFVALLGKHEGFRDAETLYAAIRRAGEERLVELPDRLDRPEFAAPLKDAALIERRAGEVSNYIAEGRLRAAIDRLGGAFEPAFEALVHELYLAPLAEQFPMPAAEPDADEVVLWERLADMRGEMAAIHAGAYVASGGNVPSKSTYNAGDYQTKETLSHPTRKAYLMDPEEVRWAIANQESVLASDASFAAVDGSLRVTYVRPGSILQTRGFMADDVIQRVNGLPIASLEDVRNLKTNPQFQNARVISVVVNRAGQQVYLTYSIPAPR